MFYLSLQEGFLSVLKGASYFRDTEHENRQKWVNSCNVANDGRQHYPFQAVPFYWFKLKYQHVHHFLQQDV